MKGKKPQKKTRSPRIAQHLPRDAQGVYTHCSASWAAIKADPVKFATPYPSASEIDADLKVLGDALTAAAGGDPVAIAALRVAEAKVRQTYELLSKYVQSIVRAGPIEDAPATISSVLMFESNIGKRPPKPPLAAKQGAASGLVLLIALAVPSATMYFWEHSVDQVTWTALKPTAQASTSVAGLTPGKVYYFRFHTFTRDNETTDLSQVVSLMVT